MTWVWLQHIWHNVDLFNTYEEIIAISKLSIFVVFLLQNILMILDLEKL